MATTGIHQIRKVAGKKWTVYHRENYKNEAQSMAQRYRKKGMQARVVKSSGKWAVMAR